MVSDIVFDLGGILVPEASSEIAQGVIDFIRVDPSEIHRIREGYTREIAIGEKTLLDVYREIVPTPEQVLEKHLELYEKMSAKQDVEFLDLVERLKGNGYKISCATNTEPEIYHRSARMGIFELFSHRFVSTEMGVIKEDDEFFERILTTLNVPAEHIAYVDDTVAYANKAEDFGMLGVKYDGMIRLERDLSRIGVKTG